MLLRKIESVNRRSFFATALGALVGPKLAASSEQWRGVRMIRQYDPDRNRVIVRFDVISRLISLSDSFSS